MPLPAARTVEWLGAAEGDATALGGKAASLDRLAKLGFRIPPGFCLDVESKFGAAVDVEAAMTAGEWSLLQARPITTNAPVATG